MDLMARRSLSIVALTVIVVVSLGSGLSAHNRLLRSSPVVDATLSASPSVIRLWFAETPLLGFSSVTLTGPAGAIKIGSVTAEKDGSLAAKLDQTLPAGEYTVSWRTAGDDGHQVRGTFGFLIRPRRTRERP
jgi:methionine-rich copper-binding protein CopC